MACGHFLQSSSPGQGIIPEQLVFINPPVLFFVPRQQILGCLPLRTFCCLSFACAPVLSSYGASQLGKETLLPVQSTRPVLGINHHCVQTGVSWVLPEGLLHLFSAERCRGET